MFVQPRDTGWLEVICGPMFSGKTEELIRRLKRAEYAEQDVQIFKPTLDDRFEDESLVSHDESMIPGVAVESVAEMRDRLDPAVEVVAIDEVQFFSPEIASFCRELANDGCRVIVAGLDLDYRGEPFDPVPRLMAGAEHVDKLTAICVECGNPANRSYRLASDPQQVLVGADEQYEARCRQCFSEGYPASDPDDETSEESTDGQ
ncbi:MAG: thymidine kinase [Bradymonadaceae bacterium]